MVTTLGTVLGTELGTELGSMGDLFGFAAGKLYGLGNISTSNYYVTQSTGGEVGVAGGFLEAVLYRYDMQMPNLQLLTHKTDGVAAGYQTYLSTSGVLNFEAVDSGGTFRAAPTRPLLASDTGRLHLAIGQHDAAGLRITLDRVAGSTLAVSGYTGAGSTAQALGFRSPHNANGCTLVGLVTVRGIPTAAQLDAFAAAVRARGDFPAKAEIESLLLGSISGSATQSDLAAMNPTHWYRADQYTTASGNLASLTNLGSAGGALNVDAGTLAIPSASALLNGRMGVVFTGSQRLKSTLAPSAWNILHDGSTHELVVIYAPTSVAGTTAILGNVGAGSTAFTDLFLNATSGLFSYRCFNAASQTVWDRNPTAASLNVPTYWRSSLSGTSLNMRVGELPYSFTTSVTPSAIDSGTLCVGSRYNNQWFASMHLAEIFLLPRAGTTQERATLDAYAKSTYGVGAVVCTHRWSLRDYLSGLDLPVVDGQAAPAALLDTVTAAAADTMTKQGSPIVRVLDTSAEGRKTYGTLGFAASANLETAAGTGIVGSAAGFYVIDVIRPESLSGTQMYAHMLNDAGNRGWYFQSNAGVLKFCVENASGAETSSATYTIGSADLNLPLWVAGHVTAAGVVRLYVRGVQVGADSAAIGTFGPAVATPMRVGIWKVATPQQAVASWYGLAGGVADPSAAELLQAYTTFASTMRVVGVTGKTDHLYDPHQDVVDNGGPDNGCPAQVLDRIGTDHLARIGGSALQVAQRVEHVWSYEQTPILYGAESFTASDTFSAASGSADNGSGFSGTVAFTPTATGASATRVLLSSSLASPSRGFDIRTSVTNSTVSANILNASNSAQGSSTGVLGASSVGKIQVFSWVWNGTDSKLYVYLNRALLGSLTITGGHAAGDGNLILGSALSGATPALDLRVFGFVCASGIATTAQIQAQHDAVMAADGRIQAIPGLTSTSLVDLYADIVANGGTMPATLTNRAGGANLTRAGSPTVGAHYTRAFGW